MFEKDTEPMTRPKFMCWGGELHGKYVAYNDTQRHKGYALVRASVVSSQSGVISQFFWVQEDAYIRSAFALILFRTISGMVGATTGQPFLHCARDGGHLVSFDAHRAISLDEDGPAKLRRPYRDIDVNIGTDAMPAPWGVIQNKIL